MKRASNKVSLGAEGATVPTGRETELSIQCKGGPAGSGPPYAAGRSLAPWRPQPGCELGLRRTLLAARRRYSLCLSAGAVATGVTCALSVSLEPKYCLPVPLQRHKEWFRSSFPRALGSWKTQKGERVRHTQRERE